MTFSISVIVAFSSGLIDIDALGCLVGFIVEFVGRIDDMVVFWEVVGMRVSGIVPEGFVLF
jgi:hypothetical protein